MDRPLSSLKVIVFWLWAKGLSILEKVFIGSNPDDCRLVIEAGAQGWESLEFKELELSFREYLGEDMVVRHSASGLFRLFSLISKQPAGRRITHLIFDPRTGSQNPFAAYSRSIILAAGVRILGVSPLVLLTDYCSPTLRNRALIVAGTSQVIGTFLVPPQTPPKFPPVKFVGPLPLAVSRQTARGLPRSTAFSRPAIRITFVGSLYEPRSSTLQKISELLASSGHPRIELIARQSGGKRIPDADYWRFFNEADIVVNTTTQSNEANLDCRELRQMNYRFMEATVSGALLVSERAEGSEKYFTAEHHFLGFDDAREAYEKIIWAIENPSLAREIARAGQERALDIVLNRDFVKALLPEPRKKTECGGR